MGIEFLVFVSTTMSSEGKFGLLGELMLLLHVPDVVFVLRFSSGSKMHETDGCSNGEADDVSGKIM